MTTNLFTEPITLPQPDAQNPLRPYHAIEKRKLVQLLKDLDQNPPTTFDTMKSRADLETELSAREAIQRIGVAKTRKFQSELAAKKLPERK